MEQADPWKFARDGPSHLDEVLVNERACLKQEVGGASGVTSEIFLCSKHTHTHVLCIALPLLPHRHTPATIFWGQRFFVAIVLASFRPCDKHLRELKQRNYLLCSMLARDQQAAGSSPPGLWRGRVSWWESVAEQGCQPCGRCQWERLQKWASSSSFSFGSIQVISPLGSATCVQERPSAPALRELSVGIASLMYPQSHFLNLIGVSQCNQVENQDLPIMFLKGYHVNSPFSRSW